MNVVPVLLAALDARLKSDPLLADVTVRRVPTSQRTNKRDAGAAGTGLILTDIVPYIAFEPGPDQGTDKTFLVRAWGPDKDAAGFLETAALAQVIDARLHGWRDAYEDPITGDGVAWVVRRTQDVDTPPAPGGHFHGIGAYFQFDLTRCPL